jgi:diguanylate cyclase
MPLGFTPRSPASHTFACGTTTADLIDPSGRQKLWDFKVVEDGPMTAQADDHHRTMAYAEIALGQIKALRLPAIPRNYEIWYAYATGYQPSLNQKINETLQQSGTVTDAELEAIYESFLAPTRLSDRIGTVGSKVMDEIEQVMAMIDAAAGSATSYTESLADMSEKLGQSKDREGLRAIVESLVHTAKEMEVSNQKLEARLNASKQEINELQVNLETVRNESLTDPLTQLANRKFFDDTLEAAIADARARNEPLSLMLTDIDHFKTFNDSFGHLTGDQVLRLVAMSVKQNVKGQDTAARYGGEEFAVVLPNTVLRSAITVADHIRRAVMTKELMKRSTGEHLGRVTVSIGVATLRKTDTPQTLIERTDACLYAAKRHGRNRVMCETDPEVTAPGAAVKVA